MPQCAVINCFNTHRKTKGNAVRYHRFPSDSRTRSLWLNVCGRYVQNCATARICSKHFSADSYERDVQHELLGLPTRCRLRKGAVPDVNIPAVAAVSRRGVKRDGDGDGQPCLGASTDDGVVGKARGEGAGSGGGGGGGIAVLLAVGLMPAKVDRPLRVSNGNLAKRHAMEGVQENSEVQDSSTVNVVVGQENHNHSNDAIDGQELNKTNSENQKYSPENSSDDYPTIKKDQDFGEDVTENGTCSNEDITDRINDDEKPIQEPQNGNATANGKVNKRKKEDDDSSVKKLKSEVQQSYTVRNKIFNELIESPACKTIDQIQSRIERIVLEIRTLNDIALEKEREWNSLIHLRKLKEELLLRMQRRKQVMLYNSRDLADPDRSDNCVESNQGSRSPQQAGSKTYNSNYHDGNRQQLSMLSNYVEMNGHSSESKNLKQRPVIDVQTIIADYRQRHPETVPRRGRRIRTSLSSQQGDLVGSRMNQSGTMNFASIALGSGAQVKHNLNNKVDVNTELGMFFNAIENSKQNGSKLGSDIQGTSDEPSFKDVLMQFAKLSQNERCELIQNALKPPPPYPEVTVHPVPVSTPQPKNSLLHGILTQAQPKTENKTTFSPTLARLLTAPERSVASTMSTNVQTSNNLLNNSGNVSISDILSHNKARQHEITITPVAAQYELNNKSKTAAQADEDEAEDSADRLVIDEGEGGDRNRADNSSDAGDEVPQCQGCNQQPAQFVCAGCGNQWYCSRDCQVSAWDEHSEVCSG